MLNRLRERLTYGNVIATIALFAALAGGTAIAVSKSGGGGGTTKLITKQVKVSASNADSDTAENQADQVKLLKAGKLTIYGKCYRDTTNDEVHAQGYIKSKKNGVLMTAYEGDVLDGDDFLNKNTDEDEREVGDDDTAGADSTDSTDHDNMVIAIVPGKSGHYRFNFQGYAKNGDVPGGDGPFKNGNRCIFAVSQVK